MDLADKVMAKKELAGLPKTLVLQAIATYLKRHSLAEPFSAKEEKVIIKAIRAELRNLVGRFRSSQHKRERLLGEKEYDKLLATHSSTKERQKHYQTLVKLLDRHKPTSILDLACGINPVAISDAFPNASYTAVDINGDDLVIVQKFFKQRGIAGKTIQQDIRTKHSFAKHDVVLLMKVLDILETKTHTIAESIMQSLECNVAIVSFATKTLSGKPMRIPRRGWFEKILRDLNLKYKTEMIPGEIFYCVQY